MTENNIIDLTELPNHELYLEKDYASVQRFVLDYSISDNEKPAFVNSYIKQIKTGTYMACIIEVNKLMYRENANGDQFTVSFALETVKEAFNILNSRSEKPAFEKKLWLHRGKDDRSVKHGFNVPKGSLMVEMVFDKALDNTLSCEAILIEGAFMMTINPVNK